MASLLEELKRRNVFRVAVGYLVLAWVVLQIADLVAPALHLPEWTLSFVTFFGIIGFPFALFFAWAFELTPEGIKRSEDVVPEDSITSQTAGNLNKITIGLLCVAVLTLLADRYFGLSQMLSPGDPAAVAEAEAEADETMPAAEVAEAATDDKPRSIAVLPFVNMSDDKEQEYFSDGISEELLNALAQIRELRVAARTSSFAFKGQNQDITKIGEQLKVETVLEGSVRKSGKRVRITAQLINVEDGYHLWSNTYDRDLTDIFAVQDEISGAIVEALKVHLTDTITEQAETKVDVAAYNLYLQARHNVRQRTRDSLELADRQYQQALEIDSGYAAAWAGRGLATLLLSSTNYGDIPTQEAATRAQEYLDTAFAIDPALAVGHAAQALLYMDDERCEEAIRSIDRALATMPNEGILYAWKSHCLNTLGDYRAGRASLEKGYEIDPLHTAVRQNWVNARADEGDVAAVRAATTPGTVDYYGAEWAIARNEGRWADMYRLADQVEEAGADPLAERLRAFTLFFWLGEPERAEGVVPAHATDLFKAVHAPEATIETLGTRPPAELSPEERHVMLVALSAAGRYVEVVTLLQHLGLEGLDHYGDVTSGESAFRSAVYLAWALRQTGESERALALANRLIDIVEAALESGLNLRDIGNELSWLQAVVGDHARAVETFQKLERMNWVTPLLFSGFFPHVSELESREDFRRLRAALQQRLDDERGKLGWEPKALGTI